MNEEKGPGWEFLPQEQRDQIIHAFSTLAESIAIFSREITVQLTPVIKNLANALAKIFLPTDDVLQAYASPKEWRIYKQTKKRRTKKKYRDRFIRRWAGKS